MFEKQKETETTQIWNQKKWRIQRWTLVSSHPDWHSTWVELHELSHGSTSYEGPWEAPRYSIRCPLGSSWSITTPGGCRHWGSGWDPATACLCKYVLLEHATPIPLPIVWLLSHYRAELSCHNRDCRAYKAEIKLFTIWLFPADSMNLGSEAGFRFPVPRWWHIPSFDSTQGRPLTTLISVLHP